MANTASALKRVRQTKVRTAANRSEKSRLKTALKAARAAITSGEADTSAKVTQAISLAGKAAKGSVLHKNTARRIQSRLARAASKKSQGAPAQS